MYRHRLRWPSPSATITFPFSALLFVASSAALAAGDDVTPWPTQGWEVSTPEAQGVSSSALADLVDYGAANEMDSLLVVRHGRIVVEAHYAPFRPGMRHLVNSVTKAVVGTLVGIAVQRGEIASVDEPVLESFPWRTVANAEGSKAQLKIAHLLDMTSGLDWSEPLTSAPPETMLEMARSRDWVGFVLDRPMAHTPGTAFNYNSGDWHVVSAILARKTWLDTLEYARRTLFAPLGIADATWRVDPQGIRSGGFGLSLQPRDMAKIGYLYLQRGRWAGQRIVSETWIDRVFHATVDMNLGSTPRFRYASGWWTIPEKRAYLAVGFQRQLIIVLPESDLVAVVTGRRNYPFLPLIDRLSAAAAAKTALPADAEGNARLADRVRDAALEKATPVGPASPLVATISGKVWRFDRNPLGLRSLMLDLTASEPRFRADYEGGGAGAPRRIEGPIGLDGVSRSHDAGELVIAAKAHWLGADTLELVSHLVNEGVVMTSAITFRGNEADVAFASNQGFTLRLHAVASD